MFAAGRRQNVVLADSLVFPSHQVGFHPSLPFAWKILTTERRVQLLCTGELRWLPFAQG